ncbi:MAG TPA: DUF167 domain-containing protein [Candidatus Nanoarchaeia archaeon]|nr:DUF167 domain-containing protein [Candidatus Nanoarchaeia archaeon]
MMEVIKIKVKINQSKNNIEKKDDYYLIKIKEKAENNKANIEIIKFLRKYFNKDVKIIKGLKSKEKLIRLE